MHTDNAYPPVPECVLLLYGENAWAMLRTTVLKSEGTELLNPQKLNVTQDKYNANFNLVLLKVLSYQTE